VGESLPRFGGGWDRGSMLLRNQYFITLNTNSTMEEKVNIWKANLTNGLILGLVGIVYSLVVYFLNMYFNKAQGYIFMLVELVILFFLVKSYRDNFRHGMITYGEALGASVIICLYYAIIMAIFTYILYTVIDSGLLDKQLAMAEEMMQKKGLPQSAIDAGMSLQRKMMKPAFMAPFSILGNMFLGLIMSLIVAAFVRKEGNPLLDTPTVQ
jgi:amino acid transporter